MAWLKLSWDYIAVIKFTISICHMRLYKQVENNIKCDLAKIEFKDVLAYGDDKIIELGTPMIKDSKVEANLIKNSKNRTVLIFKKRRRQNSRRKNGHRQKYSLIRINKIFSKDGKVLSEAEKVSKPLKKEAPRKQVSK